MRPMKSLHHCAIVVAAMLVLPAMTAFAAPAKPAPRTPADAQVEAKTMLAKAVARVKAAGRQQAFGEFTARKAPFFTANLYVVCVDVRRVVVAHGGFATYVGSAQFFKDKDGKLMPPAIWEAVTKGDGTLRYTIRDDETNNTVVQKIGFFKRIKDDVCGVVAHAPPA
jgi:cytochrome c